MRKLAPSINAFILTSTSNGNWIPNVLVLVKSSLINQSTDLKSYQ